MQASGDMVEERIADTRRRKSVACGEGRPDEEVEFGGEFRGGWKKGWLIERGGGGGELGGLDEVEDAFTCARHPMMHSCC
ncbi:hypothetical protein KPH14_005800 [Odynerus spinipes]|uniref:Uncharacterized protein n=1 Tax=Odynerus spinipes TaxID=1348599 RepID=A0AAD9VJ30_9HYME|nr:hypothetical protein KPH14_005800 [Odynerus spinipes]